jgi:hypothetical protein
MKKILLFPFLMGALLMSAPAWSEVMRACQSDEKWSDMPLSKFWSERFYQYSSGRVSAVEGMAFAQKLRQEAETRFEEFFSEYWLSAALMKSGHFPLAAMGFEKILSRLPEQKEFNDLRIASFDCLAELHHLLPSRQLDRKLFSALNALPAGDTRDYWAYRWAIEQEDFKTALKLISTHSPYRHAVKALHFNRQEEWSQAANEAENFLKVAPKARFVKSQLNHWRLFAGRMFYSASLFSKAQEHWSLVDKRSNELVQALTELSWSQLKSGNLNAAIGTALSLQTGWLSHTYSPEALMVMAMALNETCHYPESMRSIELLRKQYEPLVRWLQDHKKDSHAQLYSALASALKKTGDVPYRLSSEWIRSPRFLARQDEINKLLMMDQSDKALIETAKTRQKARVTQLLKLVKEVKKDVEVARRSDPAREDFPEWLNIKLEMLRGELLDYNALRDFAPIWSRAQKANQGLVSMRKQELVKEIEKHIVDTNRRILSQLADIYDNLKFVEIEIYQGATQDMILSNSNPDIDRKIASLRQRKEFQLNANELNWGQISTEKLGESEIWEDELGGFKADLPNKCSKANIARSGS